MIGDDRKLKEEFGDVLLQVIFHAQIASEAGRFTIKDVIELLTDKLVRRHPYVFAGEPLPEDPAAALKQRAQIKANEKSRRRSQIGPWQRSQSDAGAGARAVHFTARRPSWLRMAEYRSGLGQSRGRDAELKEAVAIRRQNPHRRGVRRSVIHYGQYRALSRCRVRRASWRKPSTALPAAFITSKRDCARQTKSLISPPSKRWTATGTKRRSSKPKGSRRNEQAAAEHRLSRRRNLRRHFAGTIHQTVGLHGASGHQA